MVDNQDELKEIIRDHGGGSLLKDGALIGVRRLEDIDDGATYTLVGGQQEAIRRHRTWTQVSDKMLEREAVKAVLNDSTSYGQLEEFHDYNGPPKCLLTSDHTKKEFDGICVNGTTVVVVEAKHHAETKHIKTVKEKVAHIARVAREGSVPRLSGITHFVPVLAANGFSRLMRDQCEKAGVGVVHPDGSRLCFTHQPRASISSSEMEPESAAP